MDIWQTPLSLPRPHGLWMPPRLKWRNRTDKKVHRHPRIMKSTEKIQIDDKQIETLKKVSAKVHFYKKIRRNFWKFPLPNSWKQLSRILQMFCIIVFLKYYLIKMDFTNDFHVQFCSIAFDYIPFCNRMKSDLIKWNFNKITRFSTKL